MDMTVHRCVTHARPINSPGQRIWSRDIDLNGTRACGFREQTINGSTEIDIDPVLRTITDRGPAMFERIS